MDIYRSGRFEAADKQAKVRLEASADSARPGPQAHCGLCSSFFFKIYFLMTIFKVFIEFVILLLGF